MIQEYAIARDIVQERQEAAAQARLVRCLDKPSILLTIWQRFTKRVRDIRPTPQQSRQPCIEAHYSGD